MTKQEREERLNQQVLRWKTMDRQGNGASLRQLPEEIWIAAFDVFAEEDRRDGSERFLDVLLETLERFDPARGEEYSHYFRRTMGLRSRDAYRDVQGRLETVSLDQPLSPGEEGTVGELVAAREPDVEERAAQTAPVEELTALILHFAQRRPGRAGNEKRRQWFRLFYTEDMTCCAKLDRWNFLHERDIFSAMDLGYLDYYMSALCRTLDQICRTALKPYSQVAPQRRGEDGETKVPLPADVSLNYLRLCWGEELKPSARSNQLKFYQEEKEQILSR